MSFVLFRNFIVQKYSSSLFSVSIVFRKCSASSLFFAVFMAWMLTYAFIVLSSHLFGLYGSFWANSLLQPLIVPSFIFCFPNLSSTLMIKLVVVFVFSIAYFIVLNLFHPLLFLCL